MDNVRDTLGYAAITPYTSADRNNYYIPPGVHSDPAGLPPLDGISAALTHMSIAECRWAREFYDTIVTAPDNRYAPMSDVPARLGAVPTAWSPIVAQDAPMLEYSTPPETSLLIQYVSGPNYDERLLTASAPIMSYGTLPGI